MTEQEAYNKGYKQGYADRIEMEKALRVDDCISREAVSNYVENHIQEIISEGGIDHNGHTNRILRMIVDYIDNRMPSVKPTREKSEWIPQIGGYVMCNNCFSYLAIRWNFCPICGADMRGEEDADSD